MTKLARGFTLIELLVVVSLIGILATLVLANLTGGRTRGRDTQRKSDLRQISTALRLYYNDYGGYPASNSSGQIMGCGAAGTTLCDWNAEWMAGTTVYMPTLPKDPLPDQDYKYEADSADDSFTLSSCLENESDDKGVTTTDTSWCPSAWMYQVRP
jgi:type II secretion system protein G